MEIVPSSTTHPAATTPRAVIIDDDPDIRHLVDKVLTQSGFETVRTGNGTDGLAAVKEFDPVVTVLDVSMPGMDGFAVARRIRDFSNTYILMLTALAEEIDVVQGLSAGADDYLLKPFRPRELRARVESLLRRPRVFVPADASPAATPDTPADRFEEDLWTAQRATRDVDPTPAPAAPAPAPPPAPVETVPPPTAPPTAAPNPAPAETRQPAPSATGGVLRHHGLVVDRETGRVSVDGADVALDDSELALLTSLMESGRRVRSTANLVLTLRGESYVTTYYVNDADRRLVHDHIASLRSKIGDDGPAPKWIETVRGVGYRMTAA